MNQRGNEKLERHKGWESTGSGRRHSSKPCNKGA